MTETPVAPSVQHTVEGAAAAAGVSEKTIRRWIASRRLVARQDDQRIYHIDQADLERAMQGPPESNGQAAVDTDQEPVQSRQLARTGLPAQFSTAIGQAVYTAVSETLAHAAELDERKLETIREQAKRIGALEAQLAAASAPKAPRPARPSTRPRRPRVSVPLDSPEEAMRKLVQGGLDPAELARIARRLKT